MRRRIFKTRMLRLFAGGILCTLLWVVSLRLTGRGVYLYLNRFASADDIRYLLVAAGNLVALNTCRAILLYLGWFYLGEGVALSRKGKAWSWLIPFVAIPSSYAAVSRYPELFSIDFGAPALFGVATVLVMHLSTREIRGWLARTLVISLLVFSFQWLDLAPILTEWGFGRGELSLAIKGLAVLEEWGWMLDALAIGLFATACAGGIAAAALLIGANKRSIQFRKIRERDQEIAALREETLRVRGYHEIQQLVHDLRRPLTTMLGLADVMAETLPNGPSRDHARRIVRTGSDMNQMIEELLKEDARHSVAISALLDYVRSQISAFPWRHLVEVRVAHDAAERIVRLNVIRFSRALVNVLDNANLAGRGGESGIELSATLQNGFAVFRIDDRGPGFPENFQISSGVHSHWGSTGIGLAFVEEVVKNHGGWVELENRKPRGASVSLFLPLGNEGAEKGLEA